MAKAKALISFNAYNITASAGDEFETANKDVLLDLEKLGWVIILDNQSGKAKK